MSTGPFFVSVIVPVYNGERFLADAIESIQAQRYHPLEIIVVDDGSTDDTGLVATRFGDGVRCVYQPQSGLPVARNTGLEATRGDVIAFLDADDLWRDDKLELQLLRLVVDPALEVVLGLTQLMGWTGNVHGKQTFEALGEPLVALSLGGAVFRRTVFDRVGRFDETLPYTHDMDWFMRARELGVSILLQQEVTLYYRRHADNMSNQLAAGKQDLLKMLKKSLERRRQQNRSDARSLPKMTPDRDRPVGRTATGATGRGGEA